ncbi:unnamed protein product [Rhizopus stolonifer]
MLQKKSMGGVLFQNTHLVLKETINTTREISSPSFLAFGIQTFFFFFVLFPFHQNDSMVQEKKRYPRIKPDQKKTLKDYPVFSFFTLYISYTLSIHYFYQFFPIAWIS